ncbi:MAG: hypothetical protein QNJ64_06905 [Crocosphaera sp.]|nr:hypothetical protein [Crocosphaera sp.]
MTTENSFSRPISIKANNQETLQYLAEKITVALTEVIKEKCPDLPDKKCEKAVRDSVSEVFDKFGEVIL